MQGFSQVVIPTGRFQRLRTGGPQRLCCIVRARASHVLQNRKRLCSSAFQRYAPAFFKCRRLLGILPADISRQQSSIVCCPSGNVHLKSLFRRKFHRRRIVVIREEIIVIGFLRCGIDFTPCAELPRCTKVLKNFPAVRKEKDRSTCRKKQKTCEKKKYCYGFHFVSLILFCVFVAYAKRVSDFRCFLL